MSGGGVVGKVYHMSGATARESKIRTVPNIKTIKTVHRNIRELKSDDSGIRH